MRYGALVVLLSDRPVGRVEQGREGRLTFTYNDDWPNVEGAVPLSLSLPLTSRTHEHERIEAFLWGLFLPPATAEPSWWTNHPTG